MRRRTRSLRHRSLTFTTPPPHAQVAYNAQMIRTHSLLLRNAQRLGILVSGRSEAVQLQETTFILHPVDQRARSRRGGLPLLPPSPSCPSAPELPCAYALPSRAPPAPPSLPARLRRHSLPVPRPRRHSGLCLALPIHLPVRAQQRQGASGGATLAVHRPTSYPTTPSPLPSHA